MSRRVFPANHHLRENLVAENQKKNITMSGFCLGFEIWRWGGGGGEPPLTMQL